MAETTNHSSAKTEKLCGKTLVNSFPPYLPAIAISALFLALLLVWYSLDKTIPVFDNANHLLKSYVCRDILLSHQSLIEKTIGISKLGIIYPPLTYLVSALFKIALGCSVWVDRLPVILFFCLMCLSTYKLSMRLLKDSASAAIAIAVVCLCPLTFSLTHAPGMMEIPLAALTFTMLWALASWNENPSGKNLAAVTFSSIATALTKQNGIIFLIFPLGVVFLQKALERDWKAASQMLIVGATSAIALAIWIASCFREWKESMTHWQEGMTQRDIFSNFTLNMSLYFDSLSFDLTIAWLIIFLMCAFNWRDMKKILLPLSACLGGLIVLCLLNWVPQARYLIQGLPFYALLISATMVRLWRSKRILARLAVGAVFAIAVCEYAYINFSPYPIRTRPALLVDFLRLPAPAQSLPCRFPERTDYGLNWIAEAIKEKSAQQSTPPTVCVVPYSEHINAQSLEYVALTKGFKILALACKDPNLLGFKFDFDDNRMAKTEWFVFEDPPESEPKIFIDAQNAAQCQAMIDSVKNSKEFSLVATKNTFGPHQVSLYKRH